MRRGAAWFGLALLGLALAAVSPVRGDGPTYVEGIVSGVWALEGNPYIVRGNATVPESEVLTITAGVHIQFERGRGLAVHGSLVVSGTAEDPVQFVGNNSGERGFWRGIHATNPDTLTFEHAIVAGAESALTVSGGSVTLRQSGLTASHQGLALESAEATLVETSISESGEAGLRAISSNVFVRGGSLFSRNRLGMDLIGSQALVENATFRESTLMDLSLDSGSVVKLRATVREGPIKFTDDASLAEVEGILAVSVTDPEGRAIPGAEVVIEDNENGTANIRTKSDDKGRVPDVAVTEARLAKGGAIAYNPFTVTATAGAVERTETVSVHGNAEVLVVIPVDLTPPTPVLPRLIVVDEDSPLVLDASASRDNDATFESTGVFTWSFPQLGLTLAGRQATHTFSTPGDYDGVLTVLDATGNSAFLTFSVSVRDVTAPAIESVIVPSRAGIGGEVVLEATASDNDPAGAPSILWRVSAGVTEIQRSGPRTSVVLEQPGTWTVTVTARDASGNEVSETRQILVVAPASSSPNPWPWATASASLLIAASAFATERGRVGFFALFLPLYTRLKDDEVLDQFTRGQIYGYIRVHPGDTYTDIKRNLALNNGTLTYHLDVLAKQGLIRSATRGARKMFYPVDVRPAEDGGALHELEQRMLRVLREAPGALVGDIAAILGVSRQLALYHLRLLSQKGLVRLERQGWKLRGFAVDSPSQSAAASGSAGVDGADPRGRYR